MHVAFVGNCSCTAPRLTAPGPAYRWNRWKRSKWTTGSQIESGKNIEPFIANLPGIRQHNWISGCLPYIKSQPRGRQNLAKFQTIVLFSVCLFTFDHVGKSGGQHHPLTLVHLAPYVNLTAISFRIGTWAFE